MELPVRKNPRLQGFDYGTQRGYFITVCSQKRKQCFSRIVGRAFTPAVQADVALTPLGILVEQDLINLKNHYADVYVDKYVIMPDHIHFILIVGCDEKSAAGVNARPTVPRIVGNFKGGISRKWGRNVWQTSFYDHIIRNQQDYEEIWRYIENNPLKWVLDKKI